MILPVRGDVMSGIHFIGTQRVKKLLNFGQPDPHDSYKKNSYQKRVYK